MVVLFEHVLYLTLLSFSLAQFRENLSNKLLGVCIFTSNELRMIPDGNCRLHQAVRLTVTLSAALSRLAPTPVSQLST